MHKNTWLEILQRQQRLRTGLLIVMGLSLLGLLGSGLLFPEMRTSWYSLPALAGIWSLIGLQTLSGKRFLQERRRQRQRLLEGSRDLLAREQPARLADALQLPVRFILHLKGWMIGLFCGAIALTALICGALAVTAFSVYIQAPDNMDTAPASLQLGFFVGGFAVSFIVMLWAFWWYSRSWVKVTEYGLQARFRGQKMQVTWEDARSFSLEGVAEPDAVQTYMLLGVEGAALWMRLPQLQPGMILGPKGSWEVYQRQSQALLEVVAGKTGLPLLDLHVRSQGDAP